MSLNLEILSRAADQARGLCMDAVQASKSGHLGLPLGCAEMGAVLYGYALKHNPEKPRWIGRDYFILSAGHGSMFLYAWLHLSGYDLPMDEIKRFRQLHSKTPGHPEFFETPGVECTTGPLGQGVGNAVTLDAAAKETQSEDTGKRFKAYGFDVQEIDGQDMQQFLDAFEVAKQRDNGRPQFIIAHTLIGKGIPEVEGTYKAHGEAGAKYVDAGRKGLGLPDEHYFVSEEVRGILTSTKRSCSSTTVAGKKPSTTGARKIPSRQNYSTTQSRKRFRSVSWQRSRNLRATRRLRRAKPAAMFCSRWPRRCHF